MPPRPPVILTPLTEHMFRAMTADDLEEIAELVVRCDALTADWAPAGWKLPDGHVQRELEVWREELAGERFRAEVACEADGTILGVVATKGGTPGRGPGSGHVTSLFVDPRAHGRGLGAALLACAEAWLRADGCDGATLSVLTGSPDTRAARPLSASSGAAQERAGIAAASGPWSGSGRTSRRPDDPRQALLRSCPSTGRARHALAATLLPRWRAGSILQEN